MIRRTAGAALVLVATLAACGGDDSQDSGQGHPDGTLHVTFTPNPLTYGAWEDWGGRHVYVTATVSPVPTEVPYVYVLDGGAAFVPGTAGITAVGPSSFRASLPIQNGLAPGSYTGTLTVNLCRDMACADPYTLTQSTLPYAVTIWDVVESPVPPTAFVKIDGAVANATEALSGGVRTYTVTMQTGHTVALEPATPFLSYSASYDSWVAVTMLPPSPPGTLRATVAFSPSSTESTGSAVLSGRAEGGGTVRLNVNLTR